MKNPFIDRVHRLPRLWSNSELRHVAGRFSGDVVNVSAFKDQDKEGSVYRDYFKNADSYSITNFDAEANGLQGVEGEIYLDLEAELQNELVEQFDVVFNHTTLEHVFDFDSAMDNLCKMSRDIVITVVPFVQQYHAHYGDYWRFSPQAMIRLFDTRGLSVVYQSFNGHKGASVYVFTIASKKPELWTGVFKKPDLQFIESGRGGPEPYAGSNALSNRLFRLRYSLTSTLKHLAKPFITRT